METEKEIIFHIENLSIELNNGNTINYGTFDINKGDFILVKGGNGVGKSTFLKLFTKDFYTSYHKILNGEIEHNGVNILLNGSKEQSSLNREISYIKQEDDFSPWSSAYTVMLNPAEIAINNNKLLNKKEKKKKINDAKKLIENYFKDYLEKEFNCDFKRFKTKRALDYSGGQRKMIHLLSGIVKALVSGSKLFLMDEPLNNLDANYKSKVNKLINKEIHDKGIPILLISHCLIFDGINKVLYLKKINQENDCNEVKGIIRENSYESYKKCLEDYEK